MTDGPVVRFVEESPPKARRRLADKSMMISDSQSVTQSAANNRPIHFRGKEGAVFHASQIIAGGK
jgi:hypothetical protein